MMNRLVKLSIDQSNNLLGSTTSKERKELGKIYSQSTGNITGDYYNWIGNSIHFGLPVIQIQASFICCHVGLMQTLLSVHLIYALIQC
jgi:hypothetical protein